MAPYMRTRVHHRSPAGQTVERVAHRGGTPGRQILVHLARTAPRQLSQSDAFRLQRAVGNRAVVPLLSEMGQRSAMVQRWPAIQSDAGQFQYSLGKQFAKKHVAGSVDAAKKTAQSMYDPWHKDPHRAAVTVILLDSLQQVVVGTDATVPSGYDWALQIDVDAVMMGPSGRAGGGGDPGFLDESVRSVVVSGYFTDSGGGLITHVSASQ